MYDINIKVFNTYTYNLDELSVGLVQSGPHHHLL